MKSLGLPTTFAVMKGRHEKPQSLIGKKKKKIGKTKFKI